ncbi:hypothetical protein J2752_000453 [Halarchaeum rubridurum]|uniref:Phage tail sheath protein n=1 Tax=Halarchaeum rubridurum TaxID=489911 RepID=A0A830FV69_9EURY|nr:hypothetical protein [Halarchaeum rubridurum]MBP1953572.1 hypothetical protein [Halarchaeum rubridurum]GGM64282.1 hypothetical protein GCM10009017_12890 [Halarchaeum rubridurum]
MTITYGSTPGTEVILKGQSITGVEVGMEELLVIFGRGDPSSGTAATNTPTQITSADDAETKFGADTELANGCRDALNNGANNGYLYGVMPSTTAVTGESHAGTQSFTLGNAPIIEDTAEITVTDTTAGTDLDVEYHYGSLATPSSTDTAYVNPFTGDVETDASSDFEIDYKYLEWRGAFDSADMVLNEGDSGVYVALSEAESVASALAGKAQSLRNPDYKMVKAFAGAEPNATTSESPPTPMYDTTTYEDAVDALPQWLAAPVRQDDTTETLLGALAGIGAGNALTNPILGDALTGVTLETGKNDEGRLTKADRDNLRDGQVIPIKSEGSITVDGSSSTSTEADWRRTYQTVRVVDRCVLLVKAVGDAVYGQLDTSDREQIAAQTAQGELEDLAADGLLEANTQDETNLYVRPAETDQGEIALEMGVTPIQAVSTFRATVNIDTQG